MCQVEQEFEEFFNHCQKFTSQEELQHILKPLKAQLLNKKLKNILKASLILAAICFAIFYFDTPNWYFCAMARTLMIQLLSLWNWTVLAKAKCLIPKADTSTKVFRSLSMNDCRACERFGRHTYFSEDVL